MAREVGLWFSETGNYERFDEGTKDADPFAVVIPSTNDIRWINSLEALLVGTSGDEWKVCSNKLDTSITATNVTYKQQCSYGSTSLQSLKVNEVVLFVDYVGRKVRELVYRDYPENKYVAPDLSVLAEHITESGIVDIAHQRNPESILWCVLDDGSLISMTYNREQDVIGWTKHPINGTALSVCVVPGADEDLVWLAVVDEINSLGVIYIVRMASRTFSAIEDCFFVDYGITVTNDPASTTIAGLDHLIGETVTVLGDGTVYTPTAVVDSNGEVEIDTAVSTAQVGLAYTYKLEPMRPDIATQSGTTHTSLVKVPEMGISFLNTMNATYGVNDDNLYDIDWDNVDWTNNSSITGLFTGDVVVTIDGGFTLDNNLIISGSDPLPCTVRALIPRLEVTGR